MLVLNANVVDIIIEISAGAVLRVCVWCDVVLPSSPLTTHSHTHARTLAEQTWCFGVFTVIPVGFINLFHISKYVCCVLWFDCIIFLWLKCCCYRRNVVSMKDNNNSKPIGIVERKCPFNCYMYNDAHGIQRTNNGISLCVRRLGICRVD